MSALPKTSSLMSETEYLAYERQSDIRHEYISGEVFAVTGAAWEHNLVAMNTGSSLNNQVADKECAVVAADMRLKVSETGLYAYPDVMVICGEPIFSDDNLDTVTNPIVLIEALSPSTEAYDRGAKFHHYKALETLQEYLLISVDSPRIERFLRQKKTWIYEEAKGSDAEIMLNSIECRLKLNEVYRKVSFPNHKSPNKES